MTEYELTALIQGELSLLESGTEWGVTIVTGYLLIAHFIGKDLTGFQLVFVNAVFGLIVVGNAYSSHTVGTVVANFMELLRIQNPELAMQFGHSELGTHAVIWARPVISLFLLTGAYIFMWHVRHSKA